MGNTHLISLKYYLPQTFLPGAFCWSLPDPKATCKRMKLEHSLTPYTKRNSKWIKDLNVKPDTLKLPEENIGKTLSDINHSRILYDPPPRVMKIKAKINKWVEYAMRVTRDREAYHSLLVAVPAVLFLQK